ncbi:hypothetical protein BDI4_1050008 [Burkholderia diffusa]|uniref:hypothetical protein n=1 Tax=Burkholderia diffusa TaxID=488732 RepID=UPI001CAC52F5|nr:hypothetical protein [Burkholderia diffusa]CAG9241428.1 hypothetical protein BDI4_1050008 [Burkholderia diffusa]
MIEPEEKRLARTQWLGPCRLTGGVSANTYGAGDRTRTGKPIKAADFRHTASFKAGVVETKPFVRWTMPSPSRAGVIAARAP